MNVDVHHYHYKIHLECIELNKNHFYLLDTIYTHAQYAVAICTLTYRLSSRQSPESRVSNRAIVIS